MISRQQLRPVAELVAWGVSITLTFTAIRSWKHVTRQETPIVTHTSSAGATLVQRTLDSLGAHAERIAANDPFRLVRRPSPVGYRPELEGAAAAPPAPPKPPLTLAGILGGPPWQAILEGLPGRDGPLVVKTGDRVGDLTIRSVRRDTVVIAGLDTVWKLTVRRTWR